MSEMAELWNSLKAERQQKRANNRASSPGLLADAGVPFEVKNDGAHLIVKSDHGETIDFWPGTGLWIVRGQTHKRGGVRKLIGHCKRKATQHPGGGK